MLALLSMSHCCLEHLFWEWGESGVLAKVELRSFSNQNCHQNFITQPDSIHWNMAPMYPLDSGVKGLSSLFS